MIPKIIHYCWISGDEFPQIVKECINSWKKLMPDYDIILWDKKMCESINIQFINDAISRKKYAFASDVVRIFSLYKYGGIYLDSDIFLKKNLTPLLNHSLIGFIESHSNYKNFYEFKYTKKGDFIKCEGFGFNAACIASEPGHPFLKDLIEYYRNQRFSGSTKRYFMNVLAPDIYSRILIKYGFRYLDEEQILKENIKIYTSRYLGSSKVVDNPDSYGVHIGTSSWAKPNAIKKIIYHIKRKIYLLINNKTFSMN